MSTRNEFNHERFEKLCSLAALGQISADEYADLRTHLAVCGACRRSRQDFLEILHEHLPLVAGGESYSLSSKVAFHDSSYKQRFLQRTHGGESVPPASARSLKKMESTGRTGVWRRGWLRSTGVARYALPVAVALLVAALGLGGFQWYRSGERMATAAAKVDQLREAISGLNRQISVQSEASLSAMGWSSTSTPPSRPVVPEKPTTDTDHLVEELARARSERRLALANLQSHSQKLLETQADADAMRGVLEEARNSEVQLLEKLAMVERSLQTRTNELEALQKQDTTQEVTIEIQKNQISELVRKVNEQAQTIQRDRELLAADRDIRELMVDRDLRLAHVVELDGSGGRRFKGRVFFTTSKLLFFAYGMPKGTKSLENFSLQAWGQRGTTLKHSAKSLGIFYTDDRDDNRWVLRYDDPKVLAQIDSVFVTLEPKKGSLKPRGEDLLYSYLEFSANHP